MPGISQAEYLRGIYPTLEFGEESSGVKAEVGVIECHITK